MRSAEKKRTSTCTFADRIAKASIEEYKRRRGHATFEGVQTVLAAILVHNAIDDDLQVVSFGVGTKILQERLSENDFNGLRVRDCHAEVGVEE